MLGQVSQASIMTYEYSILLIHLVLAIQCWEPIVCSQQLISIVVAMVLGTW